MAPIVETGKDQSYDKGAKRREKSRDAARCRRQQESDAFSEICEAIPVPSKQLAQMDRSTVMRLLISFMKLRKITNSMHFPDNEVKRDISDIRPSDEEYLDALNGFIMVLSHDCDLLFVSSNVKQYIGIASLELLGQNLFGYTHEGDHSDITNCLKSPSGEREEHSFFMRMKSTLTSTGKTVNLKSATYKVFKCEGVVHRSPEQDGPYMVAYCEPIPHPANIEIVLDCSTFLSQQSLDMKLTYCDEKVGQLLGYAEEDMNGQSLYNFCHTEDIKILEAAMKRLFRLGQVTTDRYRMIAKTGGYAWVVSQATVINNQRNQQPSYVVCVHYVLSGVIHGDCILSLPQLDVANSIVEKIVKEELEETSDEMAPQDYTDAIICDSTDSIFRDIGLEDVTKMVFSDDSGSDAFVDCAEMLAKNAPSIGDEVDFSSIDFSDVFSQDDGVYNNAPSIGDPQWNPPTVTTVTTVQEGTTPRSSVIPGAMVNVDRVKGFLKENYANGGYDSGQTYYQPSGVKLHKLLGQGTPDQACSSPPKRKLPSCDFQIVTVPQNQYRQHVQPELGLLRNGRIVINPPDVQDPPLKKQKQHSVFDPGDRRLSWQPKSVSGGLDCQSFSRPSDLQLRGRAKPCDVTALAHLLLQPNDECDGFDRGMHREPSRDRDLSWPRAPKIENASSLLPVLSLDDCAVNAPVEVGGSTLDWTTLAAALNG